MRAKRRWAAFAAAVGLFAGSVGGGIALAAKSGGDAMKKQPGHAMKSGDAMKKSDDAMKEQGAAMHGDAAMSAASMTG